MVFHTKTFRAMHGQGSGSTDLDDQFAFRSMDNFGAFILGRNMFGPMRGPWLDNTWKGWWGDNPPYHAPTFVLTHHERKPLVMQGGTTFHCTVCKHPQRAEIDRSLVANQEPLRDIARQTGTTAASLHRHKKQHLPVELTKAKEAQEVADAGTLLGRVGSLISRLETIATKAENDKKWLAAWGALREVGRCLRLLGELSGELGAGTTVNISLQLQRSLSIVLGASPDDFSRFWAKILKEATQSQLNALLTADETKQALSTIPFFDSLLDRQAVGEAALQSLTEEERENLERINAKLRCFRDEHLTINCAGIRIVISEAERAL